MYNRKMLKNKFIIIFMLLLYLIGSFFQAKSVSAHSVYYLAVTIDISAFTYKGSILQDDESFWSKESKHAEFDVGLFNNLEMKSGYVESVLDGDKINLDAAKGEDKSLVYSLPSIETDNNHATDDDVNKLYAVSDNVLQGLNDAVMFVNGYKQPKSLEELEKISVQLIKNTAMSTAGGTISYGGETFNVKKGVPTGFKTKDGFAKDDYVTITRKSDGEQMVAAYQMAKKESEEVTSKDEVKSYYFSWGSLALHAFEAHENEIYTQNVSKLTKPSKLTEMIVDLLGWLVNDLRSLLGLYSINDLIFNEGSRGSSIYVHGIAPKGWVDNALTYHMVFQGFAISLLMFSIVKTLLQRNIATVNTNVRVSLIEGFQNIIIAAILLALIIPLMNSLMYLNLLITQFFGETVPDYTALTDTATYTNLLGGVLMQLVYFAIGIYYNFIYIIRSVTLTILIALVPLFIVVFAFGGAWKAYFWSWFKEFIANVFMQSFHAMMLSLFYSFTMNSRGIESVVVLMAIIPLSNFFRQMIFGGAGDATSKLGMNSLGLAANLGGSAMNLGNKALSKTTAGAESLKNKLNNKDATPTGATSNGVSTAATSKVSSNASKLKTLSSSPVGDKQLDTSRQMTAVNAQTTGAENSKKVSTEALQQRLNEQRNVKGVGALKEGARKGMNVAAPVLKGTASAAQVATGLTAKAAALGMATALGAEDFSMVKAAKNIGDAGADMANEGGVNGFNLMKQGAGAIGRPGLEVNQYQNGDIDVSESIKSFRETPKGSVITDAYTDGNNNQVIAYDKSKMSADNAKKVETIRRAFRDGNQQEIEHYKKQGIENVLQDPKNKDNIALVYNQQGKKSMGLKSMNFDHQRGKINYGYTAGGQIGESEGAALPPITIYSPQQGNGNKNRNKN